MFLFISIKIVVTYAIEHGSIDEHIDPCPLRFFPSFEVVLMFFCIFFFLEYLP